MGSKDARAEYNAAAAVAEGLRDAAEAAEAASPEGEDPPHKERAAYNEAAAYAEALRAAADAESYDEEYAVPAEEPAVA